MDQAVRRRLDHTKYVARKHWKAYRRAHEWEEDDHHLDAKRMAHIRDWVGRQVVDGNEELEIPGHYELGHKFIVEHLIANIKENPLFVQADYDRIRTLMGRVYYRPPYEERRNMVNAAIKLVEKHPNHQQLFDALRDELSYLREQVEKMPKSQGKLDDYKGKATTQTDIFINTAGNPITRLITGKRPRCRTFFELGQELDQLNRPD